MDVVAVHGAVLDDAEESEVVGPGHGHEAAAGVAPDGVGEGAAGGREETELAEGGLGVELDDLGVVADDGDGTAERGGGDFGPGKVDVLPGERGELGFAIVAVVEELPLRCNGDVRHWKRIRRRSESVELGIWDQWRNMDDRFDLSMMLRRGEGGKLC